MVGFGFFVICSSRLTNTEIEIQNNHGLRVRKGGQDKRHNTIYDKHQSNQFSLRFHHTTNATQFEVCVRGYLLQSVQ